MTSLFGQDAQLREILDAAAGGRMHHGWILAGPRGIGKASFGRAIALRLLADAAGPATGLPGLDVAEGHSVRRLFAAGSHPDYAELTRLERDSGELARNIGVDQVRGLQRLLGNAPALSDRRIVLIDSADDLERGAANALLKNLEEPPAGTLFLLVAHAPSRLLPTIRSRCRMLRFAPLSPDHMRAALKQALPEAGEEEIRSLLFAAEGAPGRALGFAGLGLDEIDRAMAAIAAHGDPDNRERLKLARTMAGKAARPRYEAFLDRAPAFIAASARTREGAALRDAIASWEQARQVSASALVLSLDPAAVVFELGSLIAALSGARAAA